MVAFDGSSSVSTTHAAEENNNNDGNDGINIDPGTDTGAGTGTGTGTGTGNNPTETTLTFDQQRRPDLEPEARQPESTGHPPVVPGVVPSMSMDGGAVSVTPMGSRRERVQIRLTNPQLQGQRPRAARVDRATGQLRLEFTNGNIVTVPLPPNATNSTEIHVGFSRTASAAANAAGDATNADNTQNQSENQNQNQNQTIGVNPQVLTNAASHISPLFPVPVQTPTSHNHGHEHEHEHENHHEEALAKFKCALCYDFLREPVGCPSESCQARFCKLCFERAAAHSIHSNAARNNQGPVRPRCPTCRVEYDRDIPDERLREEMSRGPTMACRYEGCPERNLPLLRLRDHEANCPYEKVKCRYHGYGCPWIGYRRDLPAHESQDCALSKVKILVEKVRKLESEQSQRLNILQQQNIGNMHMLQIYRQNAQRDLLKSSSNLLDLLEYVHVITCSTRHFWQTKERWHPFFRSLEGRGCIANFLILLPTVGKAFGLAISGFQSLLRWSCDQQFKASQEQDAHEQAFLDRLLEDSILGILLGLLTALLLFANWVDHSSSVSWGSFPLLGVGSQPVMRDVLAISAFTIYTGILEYYEGGYKAVVVWMLFAIATTVYPAIVMIMSYHAAAGLTSSPVPRVSNLVSQVRAQEPILFGLRFSIVATIFGIAPTLDAAALALLLQPWIEQSSFRLKHVLTMKHCFLEHLTPQFLIAYLACKIALLLAIQMEGEWKGIVWNDLMKMPSFLWFFGDSILAYFCLLGATVLLNLGTMLGLQWGDLTVKRAQAETAPRSDPNVPGKDYHLLGVLSFGVWVSVLGMIMQVK